MKNKTFIMSCMMFLIPIALLVVFYNQLPENIPIHFSSTGAADGYAPKFGGLLGLVGGSFLIHLLVCFVLTKDPKRKNMPNILIAITFFILPTIATLFTTIIIAYALDGPFNTLTIVFVAIGILFLVIGNYLPKVKMNYSMGIRTPWTLANEEVWNKTHRLGGFCFFLAGLFTIVLAFFFQIFVFIAGMLLLVMIPIIYSYMLYQKIEKK